MKDSRFIDQARLMLRCLPAVNIEDCFALKGGTAINFFLRDMPRLSVDIDLTYLPVEPREESLNKIGDALGRVAGTIRKTLPGAHVQEIKDRMSQKNVKLFVSQEGISIKIEPNTVLRGAVFPPVMQRLSEKAVDMFKLSVSARTLSEDDLYGGKICAALDRQHPRDLFDVIPIAGKKLREKTKQAFLVYLVSHDRAMSDLLAPEEKDIRRIFDDEFEGMTDQGVTFHELIKARTNLIKSVLSSLTSKDKEFLLSIKLGKPKWDLFPIPHIRNLPAVQWKLLNIGKMKKSRQEVFLKKLRAALK